MLSPHEFAALVLVNDSAEPPELDHADIDALLAHQLVTLERHGSGPCRPLITIQGHAFLKALGHSSAPRRQSFPPSR